MSRRTNRRTAHALHVGRCRRCGKRRYPTRRDARRAARLAHPGEHLRAYRCGGYWHIGHPTRTTRLTGVRPAITAETPTGT